MLFIAALKIDYGILRNFCLPMNRAFLQCLALRGFLHEVCEECDFYDAMASCKGMMFSFSPSLSGGVIAKPLAFKNSEKRPPLSINS